VLLFVLTFSLAFSGCADDAKEADHDHATHDHGTAMAGNNTTSSLDLSAVIKVLVDGNESTAVNGSIPVSAGVNVTFDGSDSVGPNLTFAWDFGDDNESANETALHAYAAAGLYNVTLTVASGNETADATMALNVTAGGPAAGMLVWTHKLDVMTGTLTVPDPNSCRSGGVDKGDCKDHKFVIAAATPDGVAAVAKVVRVKMTTSSPGAIQMTIGLMAPGGTAAVKSASNAPPASASPLQFTHEASLVPGEYMIRVRLNAGANAAYSVAVEVDYFSV
jgi:PKD repeat protein